jgi:hypothetical protein
MEWETSLLGRKVGRVEIRRPVENVLEARENLIPVQQKAEALGFELLMSRVPGDEFKAIWALEGSGFFLVAMGMTFRYNLEPRQINVRNIQNTELPRIREAGMTDIPALQEMVIGLFLTSYYYVSPFFSQNEADHLFRAWVSNSFIV